MEQSKQNTYPPTAHKRLRVKASDGDGNRVIIPWDHFLDSYQNHCLAVRILYMRMGWPTVTIQGENLVRNHPFIGMVWIEIDPTKQTTT